MILAIFVGTVIDDLGMRIESGCLGDPPVLQAFGR
jgi:hypothetical protein